MSTAFRLDPDGDGELLLILARGFASLGEEIRDTISQMAPRNRGVYARTIHATTFLEGGVYSGQRVRGKGVQNKAQIWTIVWTDDPRGHLLELGTHARTVVAKAGGMMAWPPDKYGSGGIARAVRQPAMARRPHFGPGFLSVLPRAAQIIGQGAQSRRVRVNARAL